VKQYFNYKNNAPEMVMLDDGSKVTIGDVIEADRSFKIVGSCAVCKCDNMTLGLVCEEKESEWGEWTYQESCSKDCGIGYKKKMRNNTCDSLKQEVESEVCYETCCEEDCTVSQWSSWSECKTSCMSTRTRNITEEAKCAGECVYHLEEKQCCSGDDCSADCANKVNITKCPSTCYAGHLSSCLINYDDMACTEFCGCPDDGVYDENGDCIAQSECPCVETYDEETCLRCTCEDGVKTCIRDEGCGCVYSEWSVWSSCDCTTGKKKQFRRILGSFTTDTEKCDGLETEEKDCNDKCVCTYRGKTYIENEIIEEFSNATCMECYCVRKDHSYEVVCTKVSKPVDGFVEWSTWSSCTQFCDCPYRKRNGTYHNALCGGEDDPTYINYGPDEIVTQKEFCEMENDKCCHNDKETIYVDKNQTKEKCLNNEVFHEEGTKECSCPCGDEENDMKEYCTDKEIYYKNACLCPENYVRRGCGRECRPEEDCKTCDYTLENGTTIQINPGRSENPDNKCEELYCKVYDCCEFKITKKNSVCSDIENGLECEGGALHEGRNCSQNEITGKWYICDDEYTLEYEEDAPCCPKCEPISAPGKECSIKTKSSKIKVISNNKNCTSVADHIVNYCSGECEDENYKTFSIDTDVSTPKDITELSFVYFGVNTECRCCQALKFKEERMNFLCEGETQEIKVRMPDDGDDTCSCARVFCHYKDSVSASEEESSQDEPSSDSSY